MKLRVLLLAAVSWASAQMQPPRYKAIFEPVNVKADVKLFDVWFVSELAGWVAGGRGEQSGGSIFYTDDGGKSWSNQYGDIQSSDYATGMLRFLDAHTGWAVQRTGGGEARLLHTSDGRTWNQAGTIPEHVADYAFTSGTHGVYAQGGRIAMTNDGGQHWQNVAACSVDADVNGLTQRVQCDFTALHFPTASVGYAVSKGGMSTAFALFKTTDGGATWRGAAIAADKDAQDVAFIDANTGYVRTGYPDTGRLFRTTDGGRTFASAAGAPGDRIKFADASVGWAFHYGKLGYTTTGGDRWTSRSFTFPATVYAFSLPGRNYGYVAGDHGMVYRYHIVPVEYSVPRMIDAPAMPGYERPGESKTQKPAAALPAQDKEVL